jgi:hypothetical protein
MRARAEQVGRLAKPEFRVAEWEADECESALDDYLDAIIKWHPGYASTASRGEAVAQLAEYLWRSPGQTFIERVVVFWRAAMQSRARVLELQRQIQERVSK